MTIIEIDSSDSEDDFDIDWPETGDEMGNNSGANRVFSAFNNDSNNNDRSNGQGTSNGTEGTSRLVHEGVMLNGNGENSRGRVIPPSFGSVASKPLSERRMGIHGAPAVNQQKEPRKVRSSSGSEVDVINVTNGGSNLDKLPQHTEKRILPSTFQQLRHKSASEGRKNGAYNYETNDKQRVPLSPSSLMNVGAARTLPSSSRNGKLITGSMYGSAMEDKDDVLIYKTTTASRTLPAYMTNGKSGDNSQLVGSIDVSNRSGIGEQRIIEHDERAIYQEALQNLGQPKLEEDLPEGYLSVYLLKHQKVALAWMVQKEHSSRCLGGILADDQGLGKTISMIALIQKQRTSQSKFTSDNAQQTKSEALNLDDDDDDDVTTQLDKEKQVGKDDIKRKEVPITSSKQKPAAGTLVVCPASILRQWAREIEEKVPESTKLSVLIYHGGSRTRDPADLAKYDIVLTTYAIVTNEVPIHSADDDGEQKNLDKYDISSEFASKKRKQETNGRRKVKKKAKGINLDCDSGPLARVRWFRVILDEAQTIKNHRTLVARACSGLRAKRRWCLSGTPIQNSIDDLYSYFRFLRYDPYATYSSFCNSIKYPISRDAISGYKKLQIVLNTVLLRRTKGTLIDGQPIINLPPKSVLLKKVDFSPEERSFYLKLEADSRQQFKKYAAAGTLKQNYASILLMLLRLRQACDHPVLVKGFHSDISGKDNLDMARQLPKEMLSNLLSHFEGSSAICRVCNDPPENAVVAMCGHVFCYQCVSERLTGYDNLCPATGCKETLGTESVFSRSTLESCISNGLDNGASTSGSTHDEESAIVQSGYVSSKIKATLEILNSLCSPCYNVGSKEYKEEDCCMVETDVSTNPEIPMKAIVFSQWTGMLDLLEYSLNQSLIQYRRLDGSISLALRDRAVREFNSDPEVTVMLMSLKAGNLGLNMVAACHVILLDLWWNPTTEDQAVDRAHRIGQTRPVMVSRLTIKDTVEDRILALQEEKRNMVSSAFGEDQSGGRATKLTVEDLRYLFGI